jgi:hypothetical protein
MTMTSWDAPWGISLFIYLFLVGGLRGPLCDT